MSVALVKLLHLIFLVGVWPKLANGLRMIQHKVLEQSRTQVFEDQPVALQARSELDWDAEALAWKTFTNTGKFPTVLEKCLDNLDEDEFKEDFRHAWSAAKKEGHMIELSPLREMQVSPFGSGNNSLNPMWRLEEGEELVVAYRVKEKDVGFAIKQWTTHDLEDDFLPMMTDTYRFQETVYSRLGTTSIVYWKPTEFDAPSEYELEDNPDAKPAIHFQLIWDNSYSLFTSKTVLAMIGVKPAPGKIETVESTTVEKSDGENTIHELEAPLIPPKPEFIPPPPLPPPPADIFNTDDLPAKPQFAPPLPPPPVPQVPIAGKKDKNWTLNKARPVSSADLIRSSSSLSSSSLKDLHQEVHPLNKEQCDEAKERVGAATGFLAEIALTGYLKEIGQTPTKELMALVTKDIEAGCNIVFSDLAVQSDADFLTPDQCREVKERAGPKTGFLLELVVKHYIKELKKKPSKKMVSRVTEQITAGCEDEISEVSPQQCLGIKEVAEKQDGKPDKMLEEVQRGLESFGHVATAQLVTETAKQISKSCPTKDGQKVPAEVVPPKDDNVKQPDKTTQGVTLSPDECAEAQEAIEGKTGPMAAITLGKWLKDKNKDNSAKTIDAVMAQLKGVKLNPAECAEAQEVIKGKATMFAAINLGKWLKDKNKDNSAKTIDAVMAQLKGDCQIATPSSGVEQESERKEEKEQSVSSGTIRRKDFVEDERFAKYRMMKKLRQPEGAIEGRIKMDKSDLLKTGLTELELDCFLKLLFDKVEECNVAPPPKEGKILKADFLNDKRLAKYKMMKKLGQSRGMVESRMTMDKGDLTQAGLTDADLDCVLKLLFDEVEECDASPAGKVLGPEFLETENEFFAKYKKMKRLRQPQGAIEGRIIMDMPDLIKAGFTKTEMDCFVKLLFEEVKQCITGPAERAEKLSKEAKGLAVAKDVHEKLTSLLDGDNGLMPGVLPPLDWATEIFQAKIPKKEKTKQPTRDANKAPQLENLLDGKTQQNLGIMLSMFPDDMLYEGYLAEIGRAEWSFTREGNDEPKSEDLEVIQRALLSIDDSVLEDVKPNVDKITEKHDKAHRFVKALITTKKENPDYNPNDIISCMLQKNKYEAAVATKADTLGALQKHYETAGDLASTMSAAVNGFVVQLLNARIFAGKSNSEVSKEAFEQYDAVLRKFRQGSGGGDEADAAIVPLLALNNVIIDKSMRLRSGLVRSHPELAEKLSPTYLELFKKYLQTVIESEEKQSLKAEAEPPLNFEECEAAKEALEKAKNPMFKEMAIKNYLKSIDKLKLKAEVMEMLKEPCKKPAVAGPLKDEECQQALDILKKTPNKMFQGIKLASYFKEIGQGDKIKQCQAQVDAGCPSANPPEPLYTMSSLMNQCSVVLEETAEPNLRNSVRGAIAGVEETQKHVKSCLSVMPALKQAPYEAIMEEAEVVIDSAKQIQESVFGTMIQSAGPFLPHTKDGTVDKAALWDLFNALPQVGGSDDEKRIRGENGVPSKYAMSDFLDDEAQRYAFRRICTELLK